jgi:aryl-alcohol dehydrogenase-like predicted oxidoreductase
VIGKIALGTVQFGLNYGITNQAGKTSEIEVESILKYANLRGIKMLDTAQAYGSSEEVIGKITCGQFEIVTKINPESNDFDVFSSINMSLDRLKIKQLYGVLFHSYRSAFGARKVFERLNDLKRDGKVKKVGFSVYSPSEIHSLIDLYGIPDLIQIPFNHIDRRFETIAKELHLKGVEIHARSIFLQGILLSQPQQIHSLFEPIHDYLYRLNSVFPDFSNRVGFLIEFVASLPYIDKVIFGVNDLSQLKFNLESLTGLSTSVVVDPPLVEDRVLLPYLWNL